MFADDDGELAFTINEHFAQKYQNKKRHEEMTDLRRKYGDEEDNGPNSESEEEEDEVGELVTPEVDAQIMRTIATIRAGKPEVYDPNKKFFAEDEVQKARQQWQAKQAKLKDSGKPMHLKDFHRKQLMEGKDGEEEEEETFRAEPLTHAEEQDLIKNSFKAVVENDNDDDEDDFLSLRNKTDSEQKTEEEEYRKFLLENMAAEGGQGLKEYRDFNAGKPDNPDEAFLMEYILNRGWMDKNAISVPTYDDVVDLSGDEEAVDEAEDFERTHNFRFEEEGATDIVTHARDIEGTMRRKDDKRKKQREAKKSRQSEESAKKAEELKRLKNLKKEEIRKRLEQIKEIAGGDFAGLDEVDLENDFDPNEFDKKMSAAFDESYYEQEEGDLKPDFGDDIDVSEFMPPEVMDGNLWDDDEDEEGAAEETYEEEWTGKEEWDGNEERPYAEDDENFNMDADYLPGGAAYGNVPIKKEGKVSKKDKKAKKAAAPSEAGDKKMSLDQYLDEYYQLDYEDMIGDLPTRFKYRKVENNDFGLTPLEILEADDAELNELIGLKKLAPFRRPDLVEKDMAKFSKSKKKRLREFRKNLEARRAKAQPQPPKEPPPKEPPVETLKKTKKSGDKRKREGADEGQVPTPEQAAGNDDEVVVPAKKTKKPKKEKSHHHTNGKSNGDGAGWYIDKTGDGGKKKKGGLTEDRLASYAIPNKKKF
ncbi:hypothetical protein PhCBS80983_g02675 [Powellomyces hirtus]|uniref:Kri1-like C-terminal domain-containing protein n=1 Tax=Powellomyces hirtus TaxID=109895 RepID=A0A507E5L5_9FUNG|nr:hypothetical protein PhCBS80983_g02675 [Powellomyces hirtus]